MRSTLGACSRADNGGTNDNARGNTLGACANDDNVGTTYDA
jgi:hypothetical protein